MNTGHLTPTPVESPQNAILRTLLEAVFTERRESLARFGVALAAMIHPDHEPFTKQYISGLLKGKHAITPEIAAALRIMAAMLDGISELQARALPVEVLAIHPETAGAVVIPPPRACKLPGCRVRFVGYPAQRFCSPECRVEYHRRRGYNANHEGCSSSA